MQNMSMVFKSNSNYIQRVARQKLSKKNILYVFYVSLYSAGEPFYYFSFYSKFLIGLLTINRIPFKLQKIFQF